MKVVNGFIRGKGSDWVNLSQIKRVLVMRMPSFEKNIAGEFEAKNDKFCVCAIFGDGALDSIFSEDYATQEEAAIAADKIFGYCKKSEDEMKERFRIAKMSAL